MPTHEVLEEAVEKLGGIPGWLTLFGHECVKKPSVNELDRIWETAIRGTLKELRNMVRSRGRRYGLVLRDIALGETSWSSVKRRVEEWEGRTVSKSSFYRIVQNLEKWA